MSKIRTAHSVMLIQRRLRDAALAAPDALELAGLHDELARIERKWKEQVAAGSERRRPGDRRRMDEWFAQLARQIERALRTGKFPEPELTLLRNALTTIAARNATRAS